MPFPLLALVPALVKWGGAAATAYGLGAMFGEEPVRELKRIVYGHVVEYALTYAGLNLDPDDPLSDASFSAAVSERLGFTIRTLRDKQSIIEDLETYALGLIEQRSGYRLRTLQDVEKLKEDLVRIGLQYASQQTGIPLVVVDGEMTVDAIKGQVLAWAKAELMTRIGEDAGLLVEEVIGAGGIEAVVADLNSKLSAMGSIERINSRQIAMKVAEVMATKAVGEFQKVAGQMDKPNRRRAQNREAQRRFRAVHGPRVQYIPLGTPNEWGDTN